MQYCVGASRKLTKYHGGETTFTVRACKNEAAMMATGRLRLKRAGFAQDLVNMATKAVVVSAMY